MLTHKKGCHWPTHKKECQKLSATERQAMRGRKSLGLSLGVSRSEHDIAYKLVTLPPSLLASLKRSSVKNLGSE